MYTYIYKIYIHILSCSPDVHVSEVVQLVNVLMYKMTKEPTFEIYMYTYICTYIYIHILSWSPLSKVLGLILWRFSEKNSPKLGLSTCFVWIVL